MCWGVPSRNPCAPWIDRSSGASAAIIDRTIRSTSRGRDPLGYDVCAGLAREGDDAREDGRGAAILQRVLHHTAIDLHEVDGHLSQYLQTSVAGADVVESKFEAEGAKTLRLTDDSLGTGHGTLSDLEDHATGLDAGQTRRLKEGFTAEAPMVEGSRRDVDEDEAIRRQVGRPCQDCVATQLVELRARPSFSAMSKASCGPERSQPVGGRINPSQPRSFFRSMSQMGWNAIEMRRSASSRRMALMWADDTIAELALISSKETTVLRPRRFAS
jgi:hypothetical protein